MARTKYELSGRLKGYFKRLAIHYRSQNNLPALTAIENGRVFIKEETSYDNWNGGTAGHTLTIYLAESALLAVGGLEAQKEIAETIRKDLADCNSLQNEFIEQVALDLFEAENPECVRATHLFDSRKTDVDPSTIWRPGYLRLFVSHRDKYKREASALGEELEKFGVSSFVAHESIEPLSEWHSEIEKGLFTMDALLVFLTDDFHDSYWTDQEVGVAIGRGIPVIPLRLGRQNPYGLISKIQALKGSIDDTPGLARMIFERLGNALPQAGKLRKSVIKAFVNSKNFDESMFAVKELLPRFRKLDKDDLDTIKNGFAENDQLHNCAVVRRLLPPLLKSHFKEAYEIRDRRLVRSAELQAAEIPF